MSKIIVAIVFCALFLTGCPNKKNVRVAIETSAKLAAQVQNLQVQIRASYDQKLISSETATKLTLIVRDKLNPAVAAYTNFVDKVRVETPANTSPTKTNWAEIKKLYSAITAAFSEAIGIVRSLTPEQSILISTSFLAVEELLNLISGSLASIEREKQWQTA